MAISSLGEIAAIDGWYDSADPSTITELGGSIPQWDDKSGNERHLLQAAAANQPIISSANGKPSLLFDAANSQRLSVTGITGMSPVPQTIAIAMTPTTAAVNQDPLSFLAAGATRVTFRQIGAGLNLRAFWNGTATDDVTIDSVGVLATDLTGWHIARMQNADEGIADLLSSDGTVSTDPSNNVILTDMDEISIGARTNGANAWSGHIHEIGIWGRVLTNEERADVENYLNARWAGLPFEESLALPVTALKRYPLGLPQTSDQALQLDAIKRVDIGLVSEDDQALSVDSVRIIDLGIVVEVDIAMGLGRLSSVPDVTTFGQKADVVGLNGQAASRPVLISGSKD